MSLYSVPDHKNKHAEKGQKKKCIEYFRWFSFFPYTYCPVCPVPVVKGKQGLNYTCYPEETYKAGDKKKHLPVTDINFLEMTFYKYNADYQEDTKSKQLEKL